MLRTFGPMNLMSSFFYAGLSPAWCVVLIFLFSAAGLGVEVLFSPAFVDVG